jgi:pyrroloquinoline quinone biosynthesis protein B
MMRVRVLGSGAGGGLPQWNCGCAGCSQARSGAIAPRLQDSVAVSTDGKSWVLLNASPDIRQQIEGFSALHPRQTRDSPIAAVVLTNADIDHCLGLFVLREGSPLAIHSSRAVLASLREHDALTRTLERAPDQTHWGALELGRSQPVIAAGGRDTGISVEAVAVPGKLPPHLDGLVEPGPEHSLGLLIRSKDGGFTLGYASCVAHDAAGVQQILDEADMVLFDGTFWSSDELIELGAGHRRAQDMAHWPLSGPEGSLEELKRRCRGRCVLTHINNTNPILRDTPERRAVIAAGVRIADDGLDAIL